jgi:O-antigen ligase
MWLQPYGHPQFQMFHHGDASSANAISGGRLNYWKSTLDAIAQYPWLGSGAGSAWWMASSNGFYHVQPHNVLLQFLLTWGIIPTVPALVLLGVATWKVHHAARGNSTLIPIIMMLDCLLVISLVDGMFHFSRFLMIIFACYGICLGVAFGKAQSNEMATRYEKDPVQTKTDHGFS